MTSERVLDHTVASCRELFEVHMLLLKWGRARLAREKCAANQDHNAMAGHQEPPVSDVTVEASIAIPQCEATEPVSPQPSDTAEAPECAVSQVA